MLLNCNQGCKQGGGTTDCSIDIESDEVICNKCGDEVKNVNSFIKRTMKNNNDIVVVAKKVFSFKCLTCNKAVEVEFLNENVKGKNCNKDCKFNLTNYMLTAIKEINDNKEDEKYEHKDNK